MEPLLPLSDIEQLPEFIESPPERKAEIYDNYFTRRKNEATTEDDFNLLLKEQADRNRNSVKMQIEVNHPFLDKPEYLPKEIQDQVANIHAMDQEYKFNQEEAKPEEFRATDMEDPNRSLKIKPFKYNGQQGYSIKYPNGDVESVPGVSTKAQLTEYLKTKNDKFNGKREGVFDKLNPLAESELEGIINSINQVSSGVEGAFNQAAKTIQSMGQGLMLDDIDEIKQAANEYSDAESTIAQLAPQIEAETRKINEFGRGDKMRLAELKQEYDKALATVSADKRNSYESVGPILKEKYKELIDSVNESNKIGGAKVLDDYNKYLQSLPEAQRGDASAFANYFKDKPAQLLPYIATTAIAASPDIALGLGSSLAAGAVGGPAAAAATGQAVGYQREYTATLLSEMQLRAAKDNKQLTPEILNSYLDNPEFMDQVRTKAQTRGAVIGAADAVLGGAAQKVVESTINGTVKKALIGGAIGAVTEGAGEGLAQVASGDKANFTEIFNEAIGGLGATAVAAPAAIVDNSIKGKKLAKTAEIQEKVKQRVEAAQFFGQLKTPTSAAERVDKMKEMLPPVPRIIDKTAFEGEAEAPFAGPVESGLDGKQGFPKAAQKPFAAQEQKPLSGQAQRPFVGEVEQGLTEDAPVVEAPAAPPVEPAKEEVQLTEKAPEAPITFKTGRAGSSYTFQNGTSVRNKEASKNPLATEHQDPGIKEGSKATVFVSPEDAEAIGVIYTMPMVDKDGSVKKASVKLNDDKSITLTWYAGKDKKGNLVKRTREIKTTEQPSVGTHPMEFMEKSKHLGSIITEVSSPQLTEKAPVKLNSRQQRKKDKEVEAKFKSEQKEKIKSASTVMKQLASIFDYIAKLPINTSIRNGFTGRDSLSGRPNIEDLVDSSGGAISASNYFKSVFLMNWAKDGLRGLRFNQKLNNDAINSEMQNYEYSEDENANEDIAGVYDDELKKAADDNIHISEISARISKINELKQSLESLGEPVFTDITQWLNSPKFDDVQLTENIPTPEVETTAEVPHLPGEVNQETKDLASVATTTEEKETVAKQAKQDIADNRFAALKAEYPELLSTFPYDGTNIQEAREIVTNHLEESFDKVDAEGKEVSEAKRVQAAKLQVNLRLALNILPDKIKETNMTESQVDHVLNAMEYIMEATKDIPNMTANKMRYFNNVLSSFADGGPLVGMKGVITKTFISKWKGILDEVMGQGAIFDKPIVPVRNGPFFNLFSGTVGTMASFAHEVSHIGRNEVAHAFIRDLMGVFKDNIDFKQLEERAVVEYWYQHLNKQLPKISNQSDHMIGIAARLTQWDRKHATLSPLEQMINRNSQLTDSFSDADIAAQKGMGAMLGYNKKQAAMVKQSYDALMSGIDLATFPDEAAAVAAIEARLSPEQLSVLNKTRDMGKAFLPFLQNVKAVTKNAKLQDFANYVHDSNITPNEAGESHNVKEVSSMSDVLHERIGIDPQTGYPETSIRAIAEHQAKASTYEKHTGVERYLFRQLMADKQFTNILDSFDKSRGISERLLKIAEVYNESMTKNQPRGGPIISFIEGAFSLVAGSLIFGLNNTIKNFTAAAIARLSLVGLGNEALGNFTLYDQNMAQINKFLKQHVPTQYNRTSQYDVVEGSDMRYSFRNKMRLEKELGKGFLNAAVSAIPHLPHSAVNNIQKHIFSRLGNYSNALPERQNAFAIWTAAYIHYAQQNGTVIDGQDFLARMPHDKRAANDANDFTTKALGYAPDKASKGSFWNGSTRTKQIISKTLFGFMQQATGLAVTAQNELVKAGRLFRSGDYKEGAKALAVSSLAISNIIMFRAMTLALQGVVLYPILTQYFNGSDEEEKKKSVLKVKKSYEDTAARSNLGAMYKDVASALFPAYGAAPLITGAFNMGMDMIGAVATPNPEDGPLDLGIEFKKDLKVQSTEITEQLKALDKRIKFAEKMGLQDRPEFDLMLKEEEKLMAIKDEITKKLQFSYTTGDKEKAVLGPWGMYGIGMEYVTKQIKSFMEDDLTTDEQKELDRLLKEQVTYNDPMAEGFLNGIVEKPYSLLRLLSSGEFGKDKKDQVPTEIHMLKLLKLGQNPAVVLERARRELATMIAKKNLEQDRRVRELQQKLK